jgi:hypothetical protein
MASILLPDMYVENTAPGFIYKVSSAAENLVQVTYSSPASNNLHPRDRPREITSLITPIRRVERWRVLILKSNDAPHTQYSKQEQAFEKPPRKLEPGDLSAS